MDETGEYATLQEMVTKFRARMRQTADGETPTHGTFAVTFHGQGVDEVKEQGKKEEKSEKKGKEKGKKQCVSGGMHLYRDCFYLNESCRPSGWIPRAATLRAIEEKLVRNEKLRSQIERAKQSVAPATSQQASQTPMPSAPASYVTISTADTGFSAADGKVYPLRNSFILDSGATIHVCNSRQRLLNLQECEPIEYIYAGSEKIPMAGVGAVDISVRCGQVSRTIRLENVAFIPSFHTNVVSLQRFTARAVHWNTAAGQLFYNGSPFCDVMTQHGQWALEFNPVPPQLKEQHVHAFPTRSTGLRHDAEATTDLWHRRLGRLSKEVVLKLPSTAEGVRLKVGSRSSCQVCPVAKSTALPSRHPSAHALLPFARVHFDLQQFTRGYNSVTWALHFLDDFSKMTFVYTLKSKGLTTRTIQQFTA